MAQFDRACSRFREDSELTAVNTGRGRPVTVSPLLLEALEAALRAATLTEGDVDPTVGQALVDLGYDRDFRDVPTDGSIRMPRLGAVPGWRMVEIDSAALTARVPRGVTLDLGSTAKALAADQAAEAAAEAAGCGVLVSLSGDLAIAGLAPEAGWRVRVTDDHRPVSPRPASGSRCAWAGWPRQVRPSGGGNERGHRHHLVDPSTGGPVQSHWRTVSVAAATASTPTSPARPRHPRRGGDRLARRTRPAQPAGEHGRRCVASGWLAHRRRRPDRGDMTLTAAGPSAYWYLTRGTGAVALILLTISVVLGLVGTVRYTAPRWPRFAIDTVHRDVSLLVIVLLVLHVVTTVLDGFAPISLLDGLIPFVSTYRPLWLGLGTLAFDLILAIAITSLVRRRLGYRTWRAVHWLAYVSWPIAVLHTLGTGRRQAVVAAPAHRRLRGDRDRGRAGSHRHGRSDPRGHPGRRVHAGGGRPARDRDLCPGWSAPARLGGQAGTPAYLLHTRPTFRPRPPRPGRLGPRVARPPERTADAALRVSLSGRIIESRVQAGAIAELRLNMSGQVKGLLRLRLGGQPLPSGGLTMTGSQVDLAAAARRRYTRARCSSLPALTSWRTWSIAPARRSTSAPPSTSTPRLAPSRERFLGGRHEARRGVGPDREPPVTRAWLEGHPGLPRLLAGLDAAARAMSLAEHQRVHGDLPRRSPHELIEAIDRSGFRGRGGADFPTARKLRAVARRAGRGRGGQRLGDRAGERQGPAAALRLPHLVLDGAMLAAEAVGAREVIVKVGERAWPCRRSRLPMAHRPRRPVPMSLAPGPEGYVTGEESAVVNYLNGGAARPRSFRRVRLSAATGAAPR